MLEPGAIVAGKYQVESVIGRGGMGVVLAATHRDLGTRVALKVLTVEPGPSAADAVARFLREARAAARLRSEFVARVHDFGTIEAGRPFMVLEFLEGDDLSALLARGMSTVDLVDAICQACAGLAEAHAAGIVHRDLKPSNLFRTRRPDGSHCTKVLDFGISKLVGATAAEALVTTKTSAVLGTPLYMSPEQVRSTRDADTRSDVWSLGVVLSEALAGHAPFRGETLGEVFSRILEADALTEVPPDVPEGLVAVTRRCLEKKPDERWATVADLATALEPYASEEGREAARRARNTAKAPRPQPSLPALVDSASNPVETIAAEPSPEATRRLAPPSVARAAATADESGSLRRSDVDPATAQTEAAVVAKPREPPRSRGLLWVGLAVAAGVVVAVALVSAGGYDPAATAPPAAAEGTANGTRNASPREPEPEVAPRSEAAPPVSAATPSVEPAASASSSARAAVPPPIVRGSLPRPPKTAATPAPGPTPARTAPARPTLD